MKNKAEANAPQKKYIGGQAVIEGVMMRGENMYAMAVRAPDQTIQVEKRNLKPREKKLAFMKWPIVRGVVMFVDSLVTGMKIITRSAEMAGMMDIEEDAAKADKPLSAKAEAAKAAKAAKAAAKAEKKEAGPDKKQGDGLLYISVTLAIVLAVGLFMMLPVWLGSFFKGMLNGNTWALGIIEGLIRIVIFLIYLYLISLAKDIRRVYQYHGAEHKTINCYESGAELTVANVRPCLRLHKRCGTSFLFIVMLISMIVFLFVRTGSVPLRILSRVVLVPVIAGLSYEVIRWAGRNDNRLVRIVSAPGMFIQRMTTAEPDDGQIETAIAAMNGVLESEPDGPALSGKPKEICQPDGPSMDAAVEHVENEHTENNHIENNEP
ncbi:MAG: DUF1385 domain-containing protein [Defluviitaleaceae bacterium]|nr:DUF1385 domain-containing protein [Defluviitaleaceae bacterium]